jgi:integrase
VLRYAVELGELPSSPLERLSWKPPKVSEVVDRRVVVNPRQARELLTAVTYVGQNTRGPYARGQRLMAFYACMYFAALRPAEAVALRVQDCYLPATGWGRLTLEKSRPEVNRRWTDTASAHDERGLKHRPVTETRQVPIPSELVAILRQHIDTFGVAPDGRIFSSDRGHPVASTAISDVWAEARTLGLTPAQVVSPLAGRPYDLRHAAVSLWLNAGVPAPQVAERAGHSVEVCCGSTPNALTMARRPPTRASMWPCGRHDAGSREAISGPDQAWLSAGLAGIDPAYIPRRAASGRFWWQLAA